MAGSVLTTGIGRPSDRARERGTKRVARLARAAEDLFPVPALRYGSHASLAREPLAHLARARATSKWRRALPGLDRPAEGYAIRT